jgi:hypothetical protein
MSVLSPIFRNLLGPMGVFDMRMISTIFQGEMITAGAGKLTMLGVGLRKPFLEEIIMRSL